MCYSHLKVPKIQERNAQEEKKQKEGLGKRVNVSFSFELLQLTHFLLMLLW